MIKMRLFGKILFISSAGIAAWIVASTPLVSAATKSQPRSQQEAPRRSKKLICRPGHSEVKQSRKMKRLCRLSKKRRTANDDWRASANMWNEAPSSASGSRPTPVSRHPAGLSASVTFNEYLNSNANHPALNNKVANHQNAFVDQRQPATITFPGDGSSMRERDTAVVPTDEVAPSPPSLIAPATPVAGTPSPAQ